jgi:hypothetical protein
MATRTWHPTNVYFAWLFRFSKQLSRQWLYEWLSVEFERIGKDSYVLTVGAGGEVNKMLGGYADRNRFS